MKFKACNQNRTGDLYLTKVTLYRLSYTSTWLREKDSNLRPSGYEPDELPTAPSRDGKSGGRRIRTFEGGANGFTVRPLWPLGNPSRFVANTCYYIYNPHNCQLFFSIFLNYFPLSSLFSKYCSNFLFTRCKALSTDFT